MSNLDEAMAQLAKQVDSVGGFAGADVPGAHINADGTATIDDEARFSAWIDSLPASPEPVRCKHCQRVGAHNSRCPVLRGGGPVVFMPGGAI